MRPMRRLSWCANLFSRTWGNHTVNFVLHLFVVGLFAGFDFLFVSFFASFKTPLVLASLLALKFFFKNPASYLSLKFRVQE
jgi:hypothetical protein